MSAVANNMWRIDPCFEQVSSGSGMFGIMRFGEADFKAKK
jgi:hypothetical protein